MSTDHLIDRPARLVPCHGCRRHVLAAIDCGLTVAADPQPLTVVTEIAARIKGREVWDVITTGTSVYLAYRDIFRVRANRGLPVVAAHECARGARPRYQLIPPKKPVRKKAAVTAAVKEEKCPF